MRKPAHEVLLFYGGSNMEGLILLCIFMWSTQFIPEPTLVHRPQVVIQVSDNPSKSTVTETIISRTVTSEK